MSELWSLESSAQLFTQNFHTQHTQPRRAHRGNKAGSGAGDMPAPWLQCVSVWVCVCPARMYRVFCMGCLHWPNQADLPFVQPLALLCPGADRLLIAKCDALISAMNQRDSVCVSVLCFPTASWPQAQSVQHVETTNVHAREKQSQTCMSVLQSLLRQIKLLQ